MITIRLIRLYDVKSYYVETPQDVADGIRRTMQYVNPNQIVVTPDCGLKHFPRHIAFRKVCAMVQGTKIIREELA